MKGCGPPDLGDLVLAGAGQAEVEQLKQTVAQLATPTKLLDRLHNVREAAYYLRLTPEGVRKARRKAA